MTGITFPPSRAAGLERLELFAPHAGLAYASGRNIDPGPDKHAAVSRLSPYLRHRLLTEEEVVSRVLAWHDPRSAEKFIQEVLWRTYWKGWLEMRPSVWAQFLIERDHQAQTLTDTRGLRDAQAGTTGIEGFDDWARELRETGYLHNHARMWFASIWIFTLGLPWALGADFFLRHLIDADAASNTLSWRWVAGLQTAGKIYLATTENIERCTNHRFSPKGLATQATARTEALIASAKALPPPQQRDEAKPSILLVTHEDLHPESLLKAGSPLNGALIATDRALLWGEASRHFVEAAARDTADRVGTSFHCSAELCDRLDADTLLSAAQAAGAQQIITGYAPVGPVADRLADVTPQLRRNGVSLVQVQRRWDTQFWPHSQKGFFPFKTRVAGQVIAATSPSEPSANQATICAGQA